MNALRPLTLLSALLLAGTAAVARAGDDGSATARADAEARLKRVDAHDAAAAYRLALDLESHGFKDLAAKAYEIVVGVDPDHLAARRALGFERVGGHWLKGDDLARAKGFVRHLGRWMTSEEFAAATRPEREAAEQKAGEQRVRAELARIATQDPDLVASARRALSSIDDRFKLAPLAQALRCEPAALRLFAAQELARLANPLAAPALLKRAIYDPDEKVREAVALTLKSFAEPSMVEPLVRALGSGFSDTRVRAAQALGTLGDTAAMGAVIERWEARSGNFPRVYFAQIKQISYIADFDVQVAQTSFIADPIVGVLQEGVVQDVKVLSTEQTFDMVERTAYHDSLQKLAGADIGGDVKAWMKFWHDNKDRLLRERDEAFAKAARERGDSRSHDGEPGR